MARQLRRRQGQVRIAAKSFGSVRVRTPLAMPGMRIGLMGGSFNPPHEGHVAVAEAALKRLALDRVWWLVTPGNPLKRNDGLPPLAERVAACRRLVDNPRIEVTGLEAALGSPFTAVTVRFLRRRYPEVRFVWIMGADSLASFHRWRDWRSIARLVPMAIIERPDWRFKSTASLAAQWLGKRRLPEARAARLAVLRPPVWSLLTTRLSPLSSTALRSRARSARSQKQPY